MRIVLLYCVVIVGLTSGQLLSHPQEHESCNKERCASVVSYCLIQDKCGCDPHVNCSCCGDCANCLGEDYLSCCDCVGMRKGRNYTAILPPTMLSTVGHLDEPEPRLFAALTDQPMPALRYTIMRFLSCQPLEGAEDRPSYWEGVGLVLRRNYDFDISDESLVCTVVYFDQCMALHDCRMSCSSTGALSYRWFHNGCCQCVGFNCLNYGSTQPQCTDCMR
uniref:Twisted gastrulation protein homolog 1-like n=1 Tax=Ciona intestinalis TaxID=7719 RepID=F6WF92_CIOIN